MIPLSIITVCLNSMEQLQLTIDSLKIQTYKEFEFIIIDGGSTDGTMQIIKKNNEIISNFISEKDNGIYHAMNKGSILASGKYIMFLNSGDTLFYEGTLMDIFRTNPDEDLLYGNTNIIYKKRNQIKVAPKKLYYTFWLFDTLCHQSIFVKREKLFNVGLFDLSYKILSDYNCLLKMIIKQNLSYKYYDFVISNYKANGFSSFAENKKIFEEERLRSILENYPFEDGVNFVILKKIYNSRFTLKQILKNFLLYVKNLIKL